jgi:hypothetical protein
LYFNQQYNAIPIAVAKEMGIIAMKVFADGAMYSKDAVWSQTPKHVVRTVGSRSLPSRPLVEYSLSTPGIGTAIIGIGHIDNQDRSCQLMQNMSAAQVRPNSLSATDRTAIERNAVQAKGGKTNWFQIPTEPLGPPREPTVTQEQRSGQRIARLTWQTAYAADQPLRHYEIRRDNRAIGQVKHHAQVTKSPFGFEDVLTDRAAHAYEIVTVDATGREAACEELTLAATG